MQDTSWDSSQSDDETTPSVEENFDSSLTDENGHTTKINPLTDQSDGSIPPATNHDDLVEELAMAKAKIAELTTISQQALADLQNFKKRTEEDKANFTVFANEALITELLPALDNMERALAHIPKDPAAKEWAEGIIAIMKQLEMILANKGLEKIESERKDFDPRFHEALMTEEGEENKIIRELEKGYKIHKKIVRRSKVAVGNGHDSKPSQIEGPESTTDQLQ